MMWKFLLPLRCKKDLSWKRDGMSSRRCVGCCWIFMGTLLILGLNACVSNPKSVSVNTPDPIQAYVDANASQSTAVAAIATADYYSNQLTATVESRNLTATQQFMELQSTQEAFQVQSTERSWNATSTADSIQSTTIAVGTASAVAQQAMWTQRAINITSTADTASVQAYATQQYSIARNEELLLERKVLMNNVAAIVPWAALIFTFVVFAIVFIRWTRVRIIQRDPRGDAPLLLDVVDGVAYDADRNPTSTAGLQRADLKFLPQFSTSDHIQITARDQMLDIVTRGSSGANLGKNINKQLKEEKLLGDNTMPKIETIDPFLARPLFKDVIPHIVQDSIDAEIISQEEVS